MKKIFYFLAIALLFSACGDITTPIPNVPSAVHSSQHYTIDANLLPETNSIIFSDSLAGNRFIMTAEYKRRNDEGVSVFNAFFNTNDTSRLGVDIVFTSKDKLVIDSYLGDSAFYTILTISDGRKYEKSYSLDSHFFNPVSNNYQSLIAPKISIPILSQGGILGDILTYGSSILAILSALLLFIQSLNKVIPTESPSGSIMQTISEWIQRIVDFLTKWIPDRKTGGGIH